MEKEKTCCFTGHRKLPKEKIEQIVTRLNKEVDKLIGQGVTDFISGGALGFDQIAASLIIAKKELGGKIRLTFALPCKNQEIFWQPEQKNLYYALLAHADKIVYVSDEYSKECMFKRNCYMVDNAAHCLCVQLHSFGGTGQTLRYAENKAIKIVNLASPFYT